MKASTAVNILKATRARIEVWGIAQIGPQEVMAIAFALVKMTEEHPKADGLTKLTKGFFDILVKRAVTHVSNGGMVEIDDEMFEGIRAGYKTLATLPPDEDYKMPTMEEALEAAVNKLNSEVAEKPTKPGKPKKEFDAAKFLKDAGIDPDIEPTDDEDPGTDTSIH